jgi:uncharacterized membrane protein (UPF0127 family)
VFLKNRDHIRKTLKTCILTKSTAQSARIQVTYCDSFLSKLRGLMFSRQIPVDYGIILVEYKESKINTSIHMMFMNFDLSGLWLNKSLGVVAKGPAKRWVPIYLPKTRAQYVVELHSNQIANFSIGDQLLLLDLQ